MFNNIDTEEKIRTIIKKTKYIIPIVIVIIVLLVVLFTPHSKNIDFEDLENKLIKATQEYYHSNIYQNEEYITLHMLEDQQFLNLEAYNQANCNNSSGVLIKNGKFIPYLICPAYKSSSITQITNETNSKLKLKGNNPLIVSIDLGYVEPGYEASEKAVITGKVGNKLGIYNLNYRLNDGTSLNRLVIVTDYDEDENVNAKIYNGLELSIKGIGFQYITKDTKYEELGAIAHDSVDGDLTNKIEIYGSVNTNIIGKYTLTYIVRNSRGYQLSTTREIEVQPPITQPINIITNSTPTTLTNGKVTINLNLKGENYQYTLLPNNTRTYASNVNYEVISNGTYKFKVYNKYGELYEQKVVVSNIDKTLPSGNCYASSNLDTTVINVIPTSNKNQSYSYSIDGNYTSYTSATTYTFNKKANYAMVRIKDEVGNVKNAVCKLDKTTVTMDQPLIYIYNSHQNEDYIDTGNDKKSGVLQTALYMKELFTKEGIPVLVEEGDIYAEIKRTAAARKAIGASRYDVSKKFIEAAQKKYPSLVFFLDIHRNSSSPMTVINGKEYAVFFFLIGASHKDYEKNLAVATAIDTPIRAAYPTLARKIYVRGLHNEGIFWYNQFMGQYFQLIEIGGTENTLQQAKNTVDLITPFFADYIKEKFMK